MPFLIVSAVRAPTATAPTNSKMVPRTIAWRYEMDREETLVAQELATSSENMQRLVEVNQYRIDCMLLTCTVVECIKHSKQCANGKYIIVLVESILMDCTKTVKA